MSKLTKMLTRLFALLVLALGMASSAWAQPYYVEPEAPGADAEDCSTALLACNLEEALALAADGDDIIFTQVGTYGGFTGNALTVDADVDFVLNGDVTGTVTLDVLSVVLATDGADADALPNDAPVTVTVEDGLVIAFNRNTTLAMFAGSAINGIDGADADAIATGAVAFTTANGVARIQTPATGAGQVATIENLVVNKPSGGSVLLTAADPVFGQPSAILNVTRSLTVTSGTLNAGSADAIFDINFTVDRVDNPVLSIADAAEITGTGVFTIDLTDTDASGVSTFATAGAGDLNMLLNVNTNNVESGSTVTFAAIGNGGVSIVNDGTVSFTNLATINGSLRVKTDGTLAQIPDETEADEVDLEITGDLEVLDGADFTNWKGMEVGGNLIVTGDAILADAGVGQAVVALWEPATIKGNVALTGEVVWTLDLDADYNQNVNTVIEGDLTSDGVNKAINLDEDTAAGGLFYHNLELQGDLTTTAGGTLAINEATPIVLYAPAAGQTACTVQGADQDYATYGNALILTEDDTNLNLGSTLTIESLVVAKDAGDNVIMDEDLLADLAVTEALLIVSGDVAANAHLNADGATVAVTRRGNVRGQLLSDDAETPYTTGGNPDQVLYLGNEGFFTGDELPGTQEVPANVAGLLVGVESDAAVITVSRDITVDNRLTLCQGKLDVGSAYVRLSNGLLIERRDGIITRTGNPPYQGALRFPYLTLAETAVDADTVYAPSLEGIDLLFTSTKSSEVQLEWPGIATAPYVIRDLTLNTEGDGVTIDLRSAEDFRVNGDITIIDGILDIDGTDFYVNAVNEVNTDVVVNEDYDDDEDTGAAGDDEADGAFIDGTAGDSLGIGVVHFEGSEATDVFFGTTEDNLVYQFPGVEVNRVADAVAAPDVDERSVTFGAEQVILPEPEDALDRVDFTGNFVVTAANGTDGVVFTNTLDYLYLRGDFHQLAGNVDLGGQTFEGVVPAPGDPDLDDLFQHFVVAGDNIQEAGAFEAHGDWSEVMGDFTLGTAETNGFYVAAENGMQDDVPAFGAETFDLAELIVHGDFTVAEDQDDAPADRNQVVLNTSELQLHGDYTFLGTGDAFDDDVNVQDRGLNGQVIFAGEEVQNVMTDETPESQFDDVIMFTCFETSNCNSQEGGVLLGSDMTLNRDGELRLVLGVIEAAGNSVNILNPGFESLRQGGGGRNNAAYDPDDDNVVELGTRDSYVNGPIMRSINQGIATGGTILDGYLFPTGAADDSVSVADNDLWAPLVLQFSTLGRLSHGTVQLLSSTDEEVKDVLDSFEPFSVENEAGERGLNLNILADYAYKVEFDQVPSEDPNVRIVADFLPRASVRDIKQLRFVQFPCPDGPQFAPRLAGTYDIFASGEDDASTYLNDFINGVPNVFQEGVDVTTCQYFVVATDQFVNPILSPNATTDLAQVQIIHAVPGAGAVDVYVDDVKFINDLGEQEATDYLYVPIEGSGVKVDVVAGNAANNDDPVFTTTVPLEANQSYIVVAKGTVDALGFAVVPNSRQEARNSSTVDAVYVNALSDVDNLDFVDYSGPSVMANNVESVSSYYAVAAETYNMELVNDATEGKTSLNVYEVALGSQQGEAVSIVAMGDAAAAELIIVDADGNVVVAPVVTANEPDETLPTEFALHGNYPNPFNPSTTINFDLPASADVSIEVVDMLGRRVMTVPTQAIAAGANRQLQLDASMLASGTYLYRVTAKMGTQVKFQTGRMTLVK